MTDQKKGMYPAETIGEVLMISTDQLRKLVEQGFISGPINEKYNLVEAVQGYIKFLEKRNIVSLKAFCEEFEITPARYRRLANQDKVPPVVNNEVDYARASLMLYKMVFSGEVFLNDWCPEGLGMSAMRYRQVAEKEKLPVVQKGIINLKAAVPALIKYYQEMAAGSGSLSLTDERTRKTRAEADLKEMQARIQKGELIPRAEVLEEFLKRIIMLKQDLLPLHRRIAKWPEASEIIKKAIRRMLTEYSRPSGVLKD